MKLLTIPCLRPLISLFCLFILSSFPHSLSLARGSTEFDSLKPPTVSEDFSSMQEVLQVEFESARWMRKDLEKTLRSGREHELAYLDLLRTYELSLLELVLHLDALREGQLRVTVHWFKEQLRLVTLNQKKVLRRSSSILFENFSPAFFQDEWRVLQGEPPLASNPIWVRAKASEPADFYDIYLPIVEAQIKALIALETELRVKNQDLPPSPPPASHPTSSILPNDEYPWEIISDPTPTPSSSAPTYPSPSIPLNYSKATPLLPSPSLTQDSSQTQSSLIPTNSTSQWPCKKHSQNSFFESLRTTTFKEFLTLGPLLRR